MIQLKDSDKNIAAVLLCAGLSKRMGENKLLMHFNGKPMYKYGLDLIMTSTFSKRVLVTSHEEIFQHVQSHYDHNEIDVIINPCPERGQGSSVSLGVQAIEKPMAIMFFTGDMPLLKKETVDKIIKAFQDEDKIIVPIYNQRRGNPVIFPNRYRKHLLALQGDEGGRQIIKTHLNDVFFLEIDDSIQGEDIDNKDTFHRMEEWI